MIQLSSCDFTKQLSIALPKFLEYMYSRQATIQIFCFCPSKIYQKSYFLKKKLVSDQCFGAGLCRGCTFHSIRSLREGDKHSWMVPVLGLGNIALMGIRNISEHALTLNTCISTAFESHFSLWLELQDETSKKSMVF